jgi:hypothetical protein
MLALKGLFLRPGIFNEMTRIPEPQPRISFLSASTQLGIAHKAEMKQLHPKRLTQGSKEHLCFSEGGQARFPAYFFLPPHILVGFISGARGGQSMSSTWACHDSHS